MMMAPVEVHWQKEAQARVDEPEQAKWFPTPLPGQPGTAANCISQVPLRELPVPPVRRW